jgi:hypothetical protein
LPLIRALHAFAYGVVEIAPANYPANSIHNGSWINSANSNPHNLAFELLTEAGLPRPLRLFLSAAKRESGFQVLQLTWKTGSTQCVLESAGALTGAWNKVSTPWLTNGDSVSTFVSSSSSVQFYRLRRDLAQ